MIYLATPYTDDDPNVREERYLLAMDIAQFFISGYNGIFSPVVHCHIIAKVYTLPADYIFWKSYCEEILPAAKEVWFARIPGYTKSVGMKEEYNLAEKFNIPKRFVDPMHGYTWGKGRYITSHIITGDFPGDPECV